MLTFVDHVSEAKEQVLANLANFAYDPINYDFFRKLNIIPMFLDVTLPNQVLNSSKSGGATDNLGGEKGRLQEFATAGLCNCCLDPANRAIIVARSGALRRLAGCLASPCEETVLSALTTAVFLLGPDTAA
ncbi:ARMC7, partial [Cordylochernes scorpioides]